MATVLDPTGAPAADERRPDRRSRSTAPGGRRRHVPPLLAISPCYVLFAVFGAFPVVFSLYLSVQDWDGIGEMNLADSCHFER